MIMTKGIVMEEIDKLILKHYEQLKETCLDFCEHIIESATPYFISEVSLYIQRVYSVFPEAFPEARLYLNTSSKKNSKVYFIKLPDFELQLINPLEERYDPYGLVEYPNEVSFMLTQASKRLLKEKSNDQD